MLNTLRFLSASRLALPIPGQALVRYNFNSAVFEKPFNLTRQFEIRPGYISDWKWDFKENEYVLKLADTTFQNGRKATSKDIEFTILRPYLTSLDRPEKTLLRRIVGIEKTVKGAKFKSGMVEGISTPDDQTIIIKLIEPNPLFLFSLSESLPPLAPIEELTEDLYTFKNFPIGSGKYRVFASDPGTGKVIVERIRDIRPNVPQLIEFYNDKNAIQNNVDIAINAGANAIKNDNLNYIQTIGDVTTAVQLMDFNFSHPAAKDKNFRKFIDIAIDRKKAFSGTTSFDHVITFQMMPKDFYGSGDRKNPFNPEEAKKLLKLIPKAFIDKPLIFAYHGGKTQVPDYLQSIKSDLEMYGLKVAFQQADRADFQKQHKGAVGYFYGKVTNFADPLAVFNFYLPDGPIKANFPAGDNFFIDQYKSAVAANAVETKAPIIKKICNYFSDNSLNVPIAEVKNFYAYKSWIKSLALEKIFLSLDYDQIEFQEQKK